MTISKDVDWKLWILAGLFLVIIVFWMHSYYLQIIYINEKGLVALADQRAEIMVNRGRLELILQRLAEPPEHMSCATAKALAELRAQGLSLSTSKAEQVCQQ